MFTLCRLCFQGDGTFKHLGVVCTPDIVSAGLTGRERFVLLACDGLWNHLPRPEAVSFIGINELLLV